MLYGIYLFVLKCRGIGNYISLKLLIIPNTLLLSIFFGLMGTITDYEPNLLALPIFFVIL